MTTFKIECNYTIPSFAQEAIGLTLNSIHSQQGRVFLGAPIGFHCASPVMLSFKNVPPRMLPAPSFQLISKGHESYAGNLYGVEMTRHEKPKTSIQNLDTNPSNHWVSLASRNFGKVVQIVGIGEIQKEEIVTSGQEEETACFFPKNTVLPDIISIDKKTLEVIGILFDSNKWLYIFPDGEGWFRFEVDMDIPPDKLISQWETIDDIPKPLQVLQVFE